MRRWPGLGGMFAKTCGPVREAGAKGGSLLFVIGVRVRSRYQIVDFARMCERSRLDKLICTGTTLKILRSLLASQGHSDLKCLFETVNQRFRLERFSKQTDGTVGRRMSMDTKV